MYNKCKIVVIGLGYVGLSNAVVLAQHNTVIAVDLSQERVNCVNQRKSPLIDDELEYFLENKDLDLVATLDASTAIKTADFVIIATPTNYDPLTEFFDTASVESVISDTLQLSSTVNIVVKSTIPIGFIQRMREKFETDRIFFSPEFLREGRAVHDNLYPSRIIIGDMGLAASKFAAILQNCTVEKKAPVLFTNPAEAEAIKLFSNTYLALRVSYFNEIDSYALVNDLDSKQIIEGVSLDPRIGDHYNNPSFGYGGYCLPKDTKQLLANYKGVPQETISATVKSNETRMEFITRSIMAKEPEVVGIYKLAMKMGSDNWRQSAIQGIMQRLTVLGVKLVIFEPSLALKEFSGHAVCNDIEEFKKISDLILTNRWNGVLSDVTEKVFTRDLFGRD